MAVGYRSSSSTGASDNLASSIAVPVPAGAAANDIAVVAIELWEIGNPTVTPPSGFTELATVISGSQKLKVFWKRLTGADTGNYTFTWTGSQWNQGQCTLFTGVKTTGDPIGANFNTATSASGTTVPSTSVTVAFQPGLGHYVANENSGTKTPPTSFTEVQDANYLESNYRIPGSTGTFTASGGTLSASTLSLALLLALEPDSGGGGAVALDGTGSAANGATGTLSAARPLSGTASGAGSATGALSRSRPVDGTASAASSASGSLSVARGVTGSAPASSAADGELTLAGGVSLDGAATVAASASGTAAVERSLAGSASAASSATGELSLAAQFWRLVMPAISERHVIKGSLAVTINREATVFGDENGLYTTETGSPSPGSDDYGAIPFGTKYIWYGGHVNTTDDPAVKALWLAHGFEVENYVS